MTFALRPGPVDVHAHWLPRELFALPPGAPFGGITDRDGRLFLGDVPLSIETRLMSDLAAVRTDMERSGVGSRVLSAPPFAFALGTAPGTAEYVDAFNDGLARVVQDGDGWFAGFGCVSLADPGAAAEQLRTIARAPGLRGVALPPLLHGDSLDSEPLEAVLRRSAELGLAVLVHPMQLPAPSLSRHYLANLIGNPVETATAWHARPDVRASSSRPPEEGFRELYFDTVTHDDDAFALLIAKAGAGRVLLGSDYPFDMADGDPVRHALERGVSEAQLERDGRAFLGLSDPDVHR
jgi:aminocarboxymuconate-semialdehyde decarboxylase